MAASSTGTLTRKAHDLVKALGCDWEVSKSNVSRGICAEVNSNVTEMRERRLDGMLFVYPWLDATYLKKIRENRRVVSKVVVSATAVREDGHCEIVGADIVYLGNETFWSEIFRDITDRGLNGVQLVISDAH